MSDEAEDTVAQEGRDHCLVSNVVVAVRCSDAVQASSLQGSPRAVRARCLATSISGTLR